MAVNMTGMDGKCVCRVCGGDPYPPCTGTSDNDKTTSFTDLTTSGTQPTESTNVPAGDCSSCGGSEWSSPCLEVNYSAFRDLKRSDIIPQKSDWFSYNMTIDVDS